MKQTQKYLEACRWIAGHYEIPFATVLSQQTPHMLVYAEMKAFNMGWSSAKGQWLSSAAIRIDFQKKIGKQQPVSIRVSSYNNDGLAQAVADLIADMFSGVGGKVGKVSRPIQNNSNNGVRVYIEAEV